tara:strand:+ start:663 stop:905 length:243 start_codon:yes stop_codon:yes gene_type:complete
MNQEQLIKVLESKIEKLQSKYDEYYEDMNDPDNYYVDPNDWQDKSYLYSMDDKLSAYKEVLSWIKDNDKASKVIAEWIKE